MARPIPLTMPPRDVHGELHDQLQQAPDKHAEALLAAYAVLQELHNSGALEIARGALAASDDIIEKVADEARTPQAIRAIRNLLFWQQILGSIEPQSFQAIFKAIPEGIAKATAEKDKPVSLFGVLRQLMSKDSAVPWRRPRIFCRHSDAICNQRSPADEWSWGQGRAIASLQGEHAAHLGGLDSDYDAGHGMGSTKTQRDEEQADEVAFLFWQLGNPQFQPAQPHK